MKPIEWKTRMDWTAREAYTYGLNDPDAPRFKNHRYGIMEAREAVDNWTAAQYDHAETSFYGAKRVRAMRAYWLGRLRAERDKARIFWNANDANDNMGVQ